MHAVGFTPTNNAKFSGSEYNETTVFAKHNEIMNTSVTQLYLEDDGGAGTAGSHWQVDELNGTVAGFDNEIMTGYSEGGGVAEPLSKVSVGVLKDAGYEVDYGAADVWTGAGTGSGPAGGMVIGSVESVKGAIQGLANYRAQIGAQLTYTAEVNSALAIEKKHDAGIKPHQRYRHSRGIDPLHKNKILVRSATAMTAQANVLPELTLMLIT